VKIAQRCYHDCENERRFLIRQRDVLSDVSMNVARERIDI